MPKRGRDIREDVEEAAPEPRETARVPVVVPPRPVAKPVPSDAPPAKPRKTGWTPRVIDGGKDEN